MARGTKGLSAQYKKEMSRINRLTYGARKRGYEFDIPFRETRYGISKLKQITSVKQLYKYSTKVMASPLTGEIKEFRGDLAREFEQSKSARQGAITRELRKAQSERWYEDDSFWRSVRSRAINDSNTPKQWRFENRDLSAREIVKNAIDTEDWINRVESTQYQEPEPDYQWVPEDDSFSDEKPPTTEPEEPEGGFPSVSEDMVDRFFADDNFMNKSPYYINKKNALKEKIIDTYGIDKAAELLEKAYNAGVVQQIYTSYFRNFDADMEMLWDYLSYIDQQERDEFEDAYNESKEYDEDWHDDDNPFFEDYFG